MTLVARENDGHLEQLIERLDALLDKIGGPTVPLDDQLWDSSDVAKYLKRSVGFVQDTLAALPSFPRAYRLPSRGRARPLYNAGEVVQWVKQFKERH